MDKNDNREGSTRQLKNGSWECITQAKYLNPKTANPKAVELLHMYKQILQFV